MAVSFKRLSRHTTDLIELSKHVRPENHKQFDLFLAKSSKYVRDVNKYPAEAPAIDWSHYLQMVKPESKPMIDQFKKMYEEFKVPMPEDSLSPQIEQQAAIVKCEIEQFKKKSDKRITKLRADIEVLRSMLPFDQMTMEDFIDAYPSEGPDFLNRPTFWPHRDEDQPGRQDSGLMPGETHILQQIMTARERLTTNNVTSNEQAKSQNNLAWKPY